MGRNPQANNTQPVTAQQLTDDPHDGPAVKAAARAASDAVGSYTWRELVAIAIAAWLNHKPEALQDGADEQPMAFGVPEGCREDDEPCAECGAMPHGWLFEGQCHLGCPKGHGATACAVTVGGAHAVWNAAQRQRRAYRQAVEAATLRDIIKSHHGDLMVAARQLLARDPVLGMALLGQRILERLPKTPQEVAFRAAQLIGQELGR